MHYNIAWCRNISWFGCPRLTNYSETPPYNLAYDKSEEEGVHDGAIVDFWRRILPKYQCVKQKQKFHSLVGKEVSLAHLRIIDGKGRY